MAKHASLRTRNFVLTPHDLGRVEKCPASSVYTAPRKDKSHAQWWGIGMHKFLEIATLQGRDSALIYVRKKFPRMYAFCSQIPVDALPIPTAVEEAFLIDTDALTAETGTYREAEPDQHIYARCDIVYDDPEIGLPTIGDYKTGEAVGVFPRTSNQIKTLCTGLWLTLGRPAAVGGSIILPQRSSEPVFRRDTFTSLELDEHLRYLRRVHLIVQENRADTREGVEPDYVPGPWCEDCDINDHCEVGAPTAQAIERAKKVTKRVKVTP